MLQKLQNAALRKILGAFRTSPGAAMEIEANIPSVIVRLNKKCRSYALRVITLSENHSIRQRTPISFPPEYQTGQEIEEPFLNWNQNRDTAQRHPTQLIRILNSIATILSTAAELDTDFTAFKPWKKLTTEKADLQIESIKSENRSKAEESNRLMRKHLEKIQQLRARKTPIFYTDESKIQQSLGAGIHLILGSGTYTESHHLGEYLDVSDAEMYAILQATKWALELKISRDI